MAKLFSSVAVLKPVLYSSPAVNLLDSSMDEVSVFKARDMLGILQTEINTHTCKHTQSYTDISVFDRVSLTRGIHLTL